MAVVFYFVTHAFTKACLIAGAGSVERAMDGEADIRKMGGLKQFMPSTSLVFLVSAAIISGFPAGSCFFSMSELLHGTFILPFTIGWNLVAGVAGYMLIPLTAYYMFRLYYRTYEGEYHGPVNVEPRDPPRTMVNVTRLLAVLAIAGGLIGLPNSNLNVLKNLLVPVTEDSAMAAMTFWGRTELPSFPWIFMAITTLLFFSGYGIARNIYRHRPDDAKLHKFRRRGLHMLLWEEFRIDTIYNELFIKPAKWFASWLWLTLDEDVIDHGVIEGSGHAVTSLSRIVSALRTGHTRYYVLYIVTAVTLLMWLLRWL
jgi:NADH-quinone oxidoreductase subunit L